MKKSASITSHIKAQPKNVQVILNKLRETIRKAAPEAEETIGYGIPTYKLNGNLVHFSAYKNHIGFYPAPSGLKAFADELKEYKMTKGAVQFPIGGKMPWAVITKIVKYRVKENMGK